MENCRNWGETVWDRCWWVNNVKFVTFAVMFGVWWGPVIWDMRRNKERGISSILPLVWIIFIGGPLGVWFGMMVVEPFLFNLLGGTP